MSFTAEAGRFVVSWTEVPECCLPAVTPKSTFQVLLFPDASVEFAYGTVGANDAVVGISPGAFTASPRSWTFPPPTAAETIELPIADVFATQTLLSEVAVASRFYATHEDAYDFLVVWTNFPADLGQNVFALHWASSTARQALACPSSTSPALWAARGDSPRWS